KSFAQALLSFLVGWIIALPVLLLIPFKPRLWLEFVHQSFGRSRHIYDLANCGWRQWINTLSSERLGPPLLAVTVLIAFFLLGKKKRPSALFHIGSGLFLNLLFIAFVQRPWLYYLHPGTVLMVVGVFLGAETLMPRARAFLLVLAAGWCAYSVPASFR